WIRPSLCEWSREWRSKAVFSSARGSRIGAKCEQSAVVAEVVPAYGAAAINKSFIAAEGWTKRIAVGGLLRSLLMFQTLTSHRFCAGQSHPTRHVRQALERLILGRGRYRNVRGCVHWFEGRRAW